MSHINLDEWGSTQRKAALVALGYDSDCFCIKSDGIYSLDNDSIESRNCELILSALNIASAFKLIELEAYLEVQSTFLNTLEWS